MVSAGAERLPEQATLFVLCGTVKQFSALNHGTRQTRRAPYGAVYYEGTCSH